MERIALLIFSSTLIFAFSGMFFFIDGKTYLSNLIVVASIIGMVSFYIHRYPVGLRNRYIIWILLSYAIYLFVNRQLHGDQYGIMRSIIYIICFSLLIPRHIALLKAGSYGIVFGGFGLGIISIWQYTHGVARVEGFTNAIIFSQAALTLAILNFWFSVYFSGNRLEKWLYIISALFSLCALYLSQSRGAWLAFIVVVTCVLLLSLIHI